MNYIKKWQIIGAVFTLITGTLLHFVYEWFGGSLWAVIGSANESVWEHQKLIFWPMTIFMAVEFFFYGRKTPGFIPIKVNSILLAMLINIGVFYFYSGIVGTHILVIDIFIFIVSVTAAYYFAYKNLRWTGELYMLTFMSSCELAVLVCIAVMMVVFTFDPPDTGIFMVK